MAITSCAAAPKRTARSSKPDVVIVGGGAAGYAVANRLSHSQKSVLILEAGPLLPRRLPQKPSAFDAALLPFTQTSFNQAPFKTVGVPFDWLRVRAQGGRTLSWGGWCDQLQQHHLDDARQMGSAWPVSLKTIETYQRQVEYMLHMTRGKLSSEFVVLGRRVGLPIVAKRGALSKGKLRQGIAPDWSQKTIIRGKAVVEKLLMDGQWRVKGVEIFDSETGQHHVVEAGQVVLAASAIETARILQQSDIPGASKRMIGKGLTDHMVASMLIVTPQKSSVRGRSIHPLERVAVIPRFVNINRQSKRDYLGGFTMEVKGPLPLEWIGDDGLDAISVSRRESQKMSFYMVHAIGEVAPSAKKFVTFDEMPVFHWEWTDNDRRIARDMVESCEVVAQALASADSRIILTQDPLSTAGGGHEASVCRMGRSPDDSVVNSWGEVHGTRGLFVADAGIMPTSLDGHPTVPLLSLSLRVADRVRSLK